MVALELELCTTTTTLTKWRQVKVCWCMACLNDVRFIRNEWAKRFNEPSGVLDFCTISYLCIICYRLWGYFIYCSSCFISCFQRLITCEGHRKLDASLLTSKDSNTFSQRKFTSPSFYLLLPFRRSKRPLRHSECSVCDQRWVTTRTKIVRSWRCWNTSVVGRRVRSRRGSQSWSV